MRTKIEAMSRQNAEKLLAIFREARTQGEIVDAVLLDGSDWEHPLTLEKRERSAAAEQFLERLLESRAGR